MLQRILSLDLESYGAASGLPPQTCFTPRRCLHVDGVSPSHLILCASLTQGLLPCDTSSTSSSPSQERMNSPASAPLASGTGTTSSSMAPWKPTSESSASLASLLATLQPGPTQVLPLASIPLPLTHASDPLPPECPPGTLEILRASAATPPRKSLLLLYRWLTWADTLVGMNLGFDIPMLRHHHPLLRRALDGRHLILDLSWFNYLDSEIRPEKSLKTIGPVLGTHSYSRTLKGGHSFRATAPLLWYAGMDVHNTILAIAETSKRIATRQSSYPNDKLSIFSLEHFSSTLWCCIEMSENGLPIHRPSLEALAHRCIRRIARCELLCSRRHSLTLSGEGSQASKNSFMTTLIDAVQAHQFTPLPSGGGILKVPGSIPELPPLSDHIRDHPLLIFTEKKHELSFCEANRTLLCSLLPPSHPLQRPNRLLNYHTHASKLLGTYCYPYLWHQKAKKAGAPDRTSTLTPQPGIQVCLPNPPPTLSVPVEPLPSETSATAPTALPSSSKRNTQGKPTKQKNASKRSTTKESGSAAVATTGAPPPTASTAAPNDPPPTNRPNEEG